VVSLIAAIIFGVWVASKADNKPRSFVLLSRAAEEYKKQIEGKRQRDWILFAVSIFTSVVTGVIANVIFSAYVVSLK
jgi:hypothetical protein